ncbi:MAG TPA: HAD-IC family P-type ATPase [Methanotrichaceae archaeon]|nr:HAD-IC family P-type ATPase [Methanotrichaceae archaeon]
MTDSHAQPFEEVLRAVKSSPEGLSSSAAAERLKEFGPNTLPEPKLPGVAAYFLRQFLSPLIYILLLAAVASILVGEWSDAVFIFTVLMVNASIGTVQEYSAQRSAEALRSLVHTRTRVIRDGTELEADAEELVPGDIVLLESGSKVPADVRLISAQGLRVDESLLTGESMPDSKDPEQVLGSDAPLGDRENMTFAGTLVISGRGRGVVVATGLDTEVGSLAASLSGRAETKPPLIIRMERFNSKIAMGVAAAVAIIFAVELYRGEPIYDIFFQSVALAVAAVPEGLPVAMTVALAIGVSRMAKRNVIVRRLVAVEALGSCNYIASDKTGTLTMNQLTVRRIAIPGQEPWEVTGAGLSPEGSVTASHGALTDDERAILVRLARAAVLANEGVMGLRDGVWTGHGDTVDVALLVMALKAGTGQKDELKSLPRIDQIPFESERQFSATLHSSSEGRTVFVKGAPERLLNMCSAMAAPGGDMPLDSGAVEDQARSLASAGFRILALASGPFPDGQEFGEGSLKGLTFLGIVGMIDPLRPEARGAVEACHRAGVEVAMVTGDHPTTALAIARELGLAEGPEQVVAGSDLKAAAESGKEAVDALTSRGRVFARVEPQQKVLITESLVRQGRIVAVTGDGANDAPALHAAHVGVAMGKGGTDVARESADLIITDDNFASIVAGIEEGRVTYGNIRKVIFFSVSTGAAELFIFILALIFNMPLPLLAVQLLWLNLVTNGIQDVALAFEPAEGGEMAQPPRSPKEPIFNRLMVERVVMVAVIIGGLAFALYYWLIMKGWSLDDARNSTMLLMVLFENAMVFASRSEMRPVFRLSPLRNPLLLSGTLAATLVHVAAMYTPWISGVLRIHPVPLDQWTELLVMALAVFAAMELYKVLRPRL